jgi:DNA-binding CsgD family transcriptional regulator
MTVYPPAAMAPRRVDLIDILETAYRVDQDESSWLGAVLGVAKPALDQGLGVTAFVYDATNPEKLRLRCVRGSGPDDRGSVAAKAIEKSAPHRVRWTFRTQACALASEGPDWSSTPAKHVFSKWGIEDVLFINGVDPTGVGCFFTAPFPKKTRIHPATRRTWERVAAHLASGYRLLLRTRGAVLEADAVLDPDGTMQSGNEETTRADVRKRLRAAAVAMDHARGRARRTHNEDAVAEWTALTDARWTLLDHFDTDGKRFVVARRNDAEVPRPQDLSTRERQVLGFAALGHSNKLIAYELGISASTVGVLLSRAAKKLRARSRAELIERFSAAAERRSG